MNVIAIIGRVVRPPEIRTTTSGTKVAEFTVAVDKFRKEDGASFFRCKAWGKTADYVGAYVLKGQRVAVEGRLEQRTYEKDGQKREIVEIIAERVQGLDRPKDDAKTTTDEYDVWGDE